MQKSGLWSLKTGGLLMQAKIIVTALWNILKWSLNTGGHLIQVVFRSGLAVVMLSQYAFCFVFIPRTTC